MNPDDRGDFQRNLVLLAGLYGRQLDALQIESYWKCLKGFPLEQVLGGIERATNEETRFPPPAVLRSKMCHREIPRYEAPSLEDLSNVADGDHAKLSFKLIGKITKERMGPAKRLEAFRYMAKKFPGVGWEEAVSSTERIVARG